VQTFLPYQDFAMSAQVLDNKRLGKQRVECLQIINALAGAKSSWINHPCTKMWRGFELLLVEYAIEICDEWISRGYKDTCRDKILEAAAPIKMQLTVPDWLGSEELHASHRSNLLRKNAEWYAQYGWKEPHDLDYIWPV
jgi:hypothetical protein